MAYGDFEDLRPRHEQIAADLRAKIMSGDLAHEMPSVADLAGEEWFNASTSTIQRALRVLRDEGLIRTRQGAQTEIVGGLLETIETGPYFDTSRVKYQLLDVSEEIPPADVRDVLELGDFEPSAILRKRLMFDLAGQPVELSWSYYPFDVARGTELEETRKIKGGAPRVLEAIGRRQIRMEDVVTTRPPTSEEVTQLRLPPHSSVLRTFRVIRDLMDRPVEVSILVKNGNRFALKSRQLVD